MPFPEDFPSPKQASNEAVHYLEEQTPCLTYQAQKLGSFIQVLEIKPDFFVSIFYSKLSNPLTQSGFLAFR